ncbi:MAG: peptidoglycan editing factor PgeF [bacterium]|nr:peptidoglycan editing factor PgeF [bacterium]
MNFSPTVTDKNLVVAFSDKEKDFHSTLAFRDIAEKDIVAMDQVHGDRVVWVGKKDKGSQIDSADGLLAAEREVFLAVQVADCVPVLYFDPTTKVVAMAHAGWRGVKSGVAAKVVKELNCEGIAPDRLLVSFGPSARSCCYEVKEELAKDFEKQFGKEVIKKRDGKLFLSLQECLTKQLLAEGIKEKNIFDSGICTIHNSDKFHSFRAERTDKRGVAIIGYKE